MLSATHRQSTLRLEKASIGGRPRQQQSELSIPYTLNLPLQRHGFLATQSSEGCYLYNQVKTHYFIEIKDVFSMLFENSNSVRLE